MTDQRLQTARRAAALDPSPEARAAFLRERLRSQDTPCEKCQGVGRLPIRVRDKNGNETPLEISAAKARQLGMSETLCQVAESMRTGLPCPSCAGTGLTLRPRVELAAYCGDEGATAALAHADMHPCGCWRPVGTAPPCAHSRFEGWLFALSRWGKEATDRAAVAAARVALERWEEQEGLISWEGKSGIRDAAWEWRLLPPEHPKRGPRRAIEAAEVWIACPSNRGAPYAVERAWDEAWSLARRECPWLPAPVASLEVRVQEITHAARIAGEVAVREAIQRALIAWALG